MSKCDECGGECCKFVSIKVQLMDADQINWASMRGLVASGNWRLPVRCINLGDDGKCKVYPVRPKVCRDFEVDGQMCKDARKYAGKE